MYVLPDNGIKSEILTHSTSLDSITKPDPSLIQLLILYKSFWKDLSSMYLELITVVFNRSKFYSFIFFVFS